MLLKGAAKPNTLLNERSFTSPIYSSMSERRPEKPLVLTPELLSHHFQPQNQNTARTNVVLRDEEAVLGLLILHEGKVCAPE